MNCQFYIVTHIIVWFVLRAKRTEVSKIEDTPSDYSIPKCMSIVDQINGVSDDVYVKAMKKFTSVTWRQMFISIPLERKNAWLDRLV